MQGSIRWMFVAGLFGCTPSGIGPGGDDTLDIDAPLGPSGLIVEWSSAPSTWPSTVDQVTIERARFALSSLRVVGDAGPGDPRTTINNMTLGFAWDAGDQRPTTITFDDAPTGLYSQVAISFDGGSNDSYDIRGHAIVNSQDFEFRIEDSEPLAFNVMIDEMVKPGEMVTVSLRINFTHALDSLNWATLDMSNGQLTLSQGDAQMPMFRTKLISSFEVIDAGGSGGAL